jgi:regulator of CtrA degradation
MPLASRAGFVHQTRMTRGLSDLRLRQRLIDRLYTEAMVIADEARGYFDEGGRDERDGLGPLARVTFSCESLKVTTRLMHVIAWLLTQRAVMAGELAMGDALDPSRRLGDAPVSEPGVLGSLPGGALSLVRASEDLHRRVARLDGAQAGLMPPDSPARSMQDRLAAVF